MCALPQARSSLIAFVLVTMCILPTTQPFSVVTKSLGLLNPGVKLLTISQQSKDDEVSTKKYRFVSPRVRKMNIERAIANKKKREPSSEKKLRLMKLFKDAERRDKLDSIVRRPKSVWDKSRVPLSELKAGSVVNGTVISLTNYGIYVDVGTECDGLLHISQLSDSKFIEHPRQLFSAGEELNVTIYRVSPELKKLQLSMLSNEKMQDQQLKRMNHDDAISLDDLAVDEELWGEITRVTDYGAFVELGAPVQGFLHFMDHPEFPYRKEEIHPNELMHVGQRVRLWVSRLDREKNRIQLTGSRPKSLPLLKRDFIPN